MCCKADHHQSSNWLLWDLRHPVPFLPQHRHHWMHTLITLSHLFLPVFLFIPPSPRLSLSGNLDRWAPWWLALPIHNQFISSAYLFIIVFLCWGLLCPGVGWMRPSSWVLIWLGGQGLVEGWGVRRRKWEDCIMRDRKEEDGATWVKPLKNVAKWEVN